MPIFTIFFDVLQLSYKPSNFARANSPMSRVKRLKYRKKLNAKKPKSFTNLEYPLVLLKLLYLEVDVVSLLVDVHVVVGWDIEVEPAQVLAHLCFQPTQTMDIQI